MFECGSHGTETKDQAAPNLENWATPEEREFYAAYRAGRVAELRASNDRATAESVQREGGEAREDARRAGFNGAVPTVLYNTCNAQVVVFIGVMPGGKGQTIYMNPDVSEKHGLMVGDAVWLATKELEGMDYVIIKHTTTSVAVGCSQISAS